MSVRWQEGSMQVLPAWQAARKASMGDARPASCCPAHHARKHLQLAGDWLSLACPLARPTAARRPCCAAPLRRLRWQINATPRLSGTPGTFDGISIYRLDRRGKVYQHEVTDVQLRDPVSGAAGWADAPASSRPTGWARAAARTS